ncbi:MAG: potassium channel family protein [Clostridia bacterium]|jgi:hypothetical protein
MKDKRKQKKKVNEVEINKLKEFGFIAYYVGIFFRFLSKLSPIGSRVKNQEEFDAAPDEEKINVCKKQAMRVDKYILGWILFEIATLITSELGIWKNYIGFILILIIVLRIIDILQTNINLSIFDYERKATRVASYVRVLVNVIVNYFELILCFGFIYAQNLAFLINGSNYTDGYYFSATTQLTIGYGDIIPSGFIKFIACFQGFVGFLFAIIIISKLVSLFPKLEEIAKKNKGETK